MSPDSKPKPAAKSPAKKAAKKTAEKPAKATKKAPTEKAPAKKAPAKKTTPKVAEPVVEEVDEVEAVAELHDHEGHDHEGHGHEELSEEEQAQAEEDVARMAQALAALDDDVLGRALADMSEKLRVDVAAQLQLPRATMRLGDALIPLVRRKLQTAAPDHQLQVLFALAQHVNDQTIEALGPRAEEPTREDLLEVLPEVIETHGATLVTLMLVGYAASDALCRPVMRDLFETDDRFTIGPPVAVEAKPEIGALPAPTLDKAELEAKREQRRATKDAKRARGATRARGARRCAGETSPSRAPSEAQGALGGCDARQRHPRWHGRRRHGRAGAPGRRRHPRRPHRRDRQDQRGSRERRSTPTGSSSPPASSTRTRTTTRSSSGTRPRRRRTCTA